MHKLGRVVDDGPDWGHLKEICIKGCLFVVIVILSVLVGHPAARHLHGLGPLFIHAAAGFDGHIRGERGSVGAVHVLKFGEILPDVDGEAGGDGGAEGSGFVH